MKNNQLPVIEPFLIDLNQLQGIYVEASQDSEVYLCEQDEWNTVPENQSLINLIKRVLELKK